MSSGNVLADRRLAFAGMLRERGDLDDAVSLYEEALALVPGWAPGHFALAETLEALGRYQDACAAYRACLAAADEDTLGATARLALIGGALVPDRLPEAYVRTLFDQYAPRFDQALVERLDYRAPFQLREAVDAASPGPDGFARVLDLGCGTGLAGEAFRARAGWLVGIDLSPGMIAEARRKGVYDDLTEGDATAATVAGSGFDLVVAADVLVYLGALEAPFASVHAALTPGGLFAFSAERGTAPGFALARTCRYAHHPDYLRAAATAAGFEVLTLADAVCRREAGEDVASLVVILRRRPDAALRPDPAYTDSPAHQPLDHAHWKL